jgi:hypothetical protein
MLKQEYYEWPFLKNTYKPSLFIVKECLLFESILLTKGAQYHLLHGFRFKGD